MAAPGWATVKFSTSAAGPGREVEAAKKVSAER